MCSQHGIESDSKTPDVNQLRVVGLSLDDFWRGIGRCSTDGLSELSNMREAAKAKIDEFHVPVFIEEHVFRLDVPMAQPALLEVE